MRQALRHHRRHEENGGRTVKDHAGIRLPWVGSGAPHAVLDLLRGCNAACDGCYNATAEFTPKPVAQVRTELQRLQELRRLHTVSLTGGEPLLHPDVDDIIRDVHGRGPRTVLMTNGILFDEARARRLKTAGLDMVLLHIQERQNRPDLPPNHGPDEIEKLRRAKAGIAAAAGLDAGFSALMYPDAASRAEIRHLLAEIAESSTVHFAMICPQGDFSVFADLNGTLASGYRQPRSVSAGSSSAESVVAQGEDLYGILRDAGFAMFAWIGASDNSGEPRWSAWNTGVLRAAAGLRALPLQPAWTDRLLLGLVRLLAGRHLFHCRASTARFRFQLALGLLDPRRTLTALRLLAGSLRPGVRLLRKHVVVELPPAQRPDGSIVICGECPDATLRNGRLVPPCLADRMSQTSHFDCHSGPTP